MTRQGGTWSRDICASLPRLAITMTTRGGPGSPCVAPRITQGVGVCAGPRPVDPACSPPILLPPVPGAPPIARLLPLLVRTVRFD